MATYPTCGRVDFFLGFSLKSFNFVHFSRSSEEQANVGLNSDIVSSHTVDVSFMNQAFLKLSLALKVIRWT